MKKSWKIIALVLGILLLSVAGYLVYIFQFKEYETADENVDKVIEEEYKVELPDGSTIITDKDGNVIEDKDASGEAATDEESATEGDSAENSSEGSSSNAGTAGGTSDEASATTPGTATSSDGNAPKQTSGSNGSPATSGSTGSTTGSTDPSESSAGGSGAKADSGSSGSGSTGTDAGGVTVASIKQKYEPTLADVEAQVASRINGLIGAAQTEYAEKKANGENINYAYFYNKYVNAATELENRTDTVFYAIIGSLKNELKANGMAESHADSFVSEYEARKEARKKDLISKASGM